MEEENQDDTADGREPEALRGTERPSVSNEKVPQTSGEDELEKNVDKQNKKSEQVKEPYDAEHSKKNEDVTTGAQKKQTILCICCPSNKKRFEDTSEEIKCKPDANRSAKAVGKPSIRTSSNQDHVETSAEKTKRKDIEILFNRLHIQDKSTQRLSTADFLKIGSSIKQDHVVLEKDLVHTFLQRLMMLDYRARYIPVKQDSPEVVCTVERVNGNLEDFYSTSFETAELKQTHVHPMDVQMAVFHCSDSFLKQNMITKLSQCQYALPLLVPDPVTSDIECPLWTFRKIIKTWKITQTKGDSNCVTMKSLPIYRAETPMVSFYRLGSLPVSKSQLMNAVINERHSTFFHRNCTGSTKCRVLMDGVAEIAWYCPAGKPNDAFTDCVAFCNLHGDALELEQQREILVEKSSVNVVLVPALEKGDESSTIISALLKSKKPLICLVADDSCDAVMKKKGKYKMGLKDKSLCDVSAKLKKIIGQILSEPHICFTLETMANVSGITVDENDASCHKGKSAAMEIVNLFQTMNVSEIKEKCLPCQGKPWQDWCKTNKELYHLKGNLEINKCEKENELMQIRQRQCNVSSGELMKLFINNLSSLSSTDKEVFLKWTQILLDALCTDDLSSILQSYDETWSEVLIQKKLHDKTKKKEQKLKEKQEKLEKISKQLQSATFGLEHIFREMGQIYEAHKSVNRRPAEVRTDWSRFPELAAELMISGHPMELMDGDAGHVPLTWVSSVLDEVIRKLGDRRVFVLSVLGVQSSGKSTMLNAMFGLQFAVSAGRCTKGAFMQLVKVSEKMKKLRFDYVLVVDTEGLRALELAGNNTLHHDNKLATFVVGLGNMTLINIFGENPSDMQDILQIVVQAFMRMKKVRLSPSCVFVHQNVTDITAAEKNMDGKRRLQEKLDQMAKLAAKEEGSNAESFSDVIAFDVQRDVKYFAQLWEGSPPMAPPNPGYSESVQELKDFILSKASTSAGVTLSQLKGKIQDLWNALMNESFVFSFKNTLEIAVYRKLEVKYGNWTWALRSNMLTVENQLYTRIENGQLDKVELSYLFKETSKTYEEITNDMAEYFEDDRDKDILVQWRGQFQIKIKQFLEEHVMEVKRKLDEVLQQKNACKKLDDQKTEYENRLLQRSKELAQSLKDKAKDEKELEHQFNKVWSSWVRDLTENTTAIEDINFKEDQLNILRETGIEWTVINESKSTGTYKNISVVGDYSSYISSTKQQEQTSCDTNHQTKNLGHRIVSFISPRISEMLFSNKPISSTTSSLPYEIQNGIRSLIDNVERDTLNKIKSKPVATRGYSTTYLQEMVKHVQDKVTEFESQTKCSLKKEFTVHLLLFVFHRAESWILDSQEKFKQNNHAATFVNNKKMQFYNIFRSYCKGSSSAVVLGELICEKLKVAAVEAVCNKTAIGLSIEMKCNYPVFSENRLNLEKHVLKSLAEKEDFNGLITYIRHPRRYVERFIKEEAEKYIFTEHKDKAQNILKKNAEDLRKLVSQALFTATEKVKQLRGDTNMWLKEFLTLLKDELTFDTICSQNFSDINNFDFLKEEIEKGFTSITEQMSSLSLDAMRKSRLQPDQILIDQLCNCCWAQCPFCAAVCTNTLKEHDEDHSVPYHRSPAVRGMHYRGTVHMSVEFCTTKVSSDGRFHPDSSDRSIAFKEYRTAGPPFDNWSITPDGSKLTYWKWVVCKFQKQLEDHYKLKFESHGEIPSQWKTHSKDKAIKCLDEMW